MINFEFIVTAKPKKKHKIEAFNGHLDANKNRGLDNYRTVDGNCKVLRLLS